MEDQVTLLVMSQTNEVDTHLLHLQHILSHLRIRHRSPYTRMILMTVCATQQQSSTVEHKRSVLHELGLPETERNLKGLLFTGGM